MEFVHDFIALMMFSLELIGAAILLVCWMVMATITFIAIALGTLGLPLLYLALGPAFFLTQLFRGASFCTTWRGRLASVMADLTTLLIMMLGVYLTFGEPLIVYTESVKSFSWWGLPLAFYLATGVNYLSTLAHARRVGKR